MVHDIQSCLLDTCLWKLQSIYLSYCMFVFLWCFFFLSDTVQVVSLLKLTVFFVYPVCYQAIFPKALTYLCMIFVCSIRDFQGSTRQKHESATCLKALTSFKYSVTLSLHLKSPISPHSSSSLALRTRIISISFDFSNYDTLSYTVRSLICYCNWSFFLRILL